MEGPERGTEGFLARRKRRRIRRIYLGLAVLLAGAVLAAAFYGAYTMVRDFRSAQMTSQARELLAEAKVREALVRAQSALTLSPESPEAWRSMAAVMEAIGNPLALGCYEKLDTLGVSTVEDRRNYVRAAVQLGHTSAARRQADLLKQSGDAGFLDFVAADEAMRQGNRQAAEQALRRVPGTSAAGREAKLLLGQMLVARGEPAARDEALGFFRELSAGDDRVAASALATALTAGLVPAGERADWAARLQSHPAGDEKTFLVVQSARLADDPSSRPQILEEVVAHFSGRGVELRTPAVVWLNALQEYDLALRLLSSNEARGSPDTYVAWLDTLAGKGDWARVESALAGGRIPLHGVALEMFRARAARMTGKEGAARQGYQRAINMALREPAKMGSVMTFLENDGQTDLLRETLSEALSEPATAGSAKDALIVIEKRSRDAGKMRALLAKLCKALPEDKDLRSASIYYDLVLGNRALGAEAFRMRSEEPENFARRAVHALAVLQQGFPEKAVRVFDGLSVRSDLITPEQKAVVVSVLAAKGRMDQAQAMASTLNESELTREEAAMVSSYLRPASDQTQVPVPEETPAP